MPNLLALHLMFIPLHASNHYSRIINYRIDSSGGRVEVFKRRQITQIDRQKYDDVGRQRRWDEKKGEGRGREREARHQGTGRGGREKQTNGLG